MRIYIVDVISLVNRYRIEQKISADEGATRVKNSAVNGPLVGIPPVADVVDVGEYTYLGNGIRTLHYDRVDDGLVNTYDAISQQQGICCRSVGYPVEEASIPSGRLYERGIISLCYTRSEVLQVRILGVDRVAGLAWGAWRWMGDYISVGGNNEGPKQCVHH